MENNVVMVLEADPLQEHVFALMTELGLPVAGGTADTPRRVAKMYREVFRGLTEDMPKMTCFNAPNEDIVRIDGIAVNSFCEHHLLPFFGECSIVYRPKEKMLGLSKFPRFVAWASARPTTQEELTRFIRVQLEKVLETNVKVTMKCVHTCMRVRGALAQSSVTTTESGSV